MYQLVGSEKILETVILLSYQQFLNEEDRNSTTLKRSYKKFLGSIQKSTSVINFDTTNINFVTDIFAVEDLSKLYDSFSSLDDKSQSKAIVVSHSSQDIESMLNNIEKSYNAFSKIKDNYPEFSSLFELIINNVFCAPSKVAGGGSTSNAIGVIWISPRDNWQFNDFVEFYFHEFTHNLVFLDERRFHHYDYELLSDSSNFCRSAILCVPRPLDKVFHSLLVATEIIMLRNNIIGHPEQPKIHPPTDIILKNCFETIESIELVQARVNILTKRGVELMNLCQNYLETFDKSFSKSARALVSC